MADLEQQASSDGIDVPFTFNQCCGSQTFTTGLGAVNISGTDNYPLGFDCANTSNFGQPYGYPVFPDMPHLPAGVSRAARSTAGAAPAMTTATR